MYIFRIVLIVYRFRKSFKLKFNKLWVAVENKFEVFFRINCGRFLYEAILFAFSKHGGIVTVKFGYNLNRYVNQFT